jgi:hypothetical protein
MVTPLERQICYFGLFSIYSYTVYKFVQTRKSFDKNFHDALINQGNEFIQELNNTNLKFIHTPNQKVLFLFGVTNKSEFLKNENFEIIQILIENFKPNYFIYEKDLK